ncbi:hypothetical protein BU16DRAFT_576687 [Lophium mytilinum]|uniref:Uncharacterized protein n=1 Tax=Lophium mytilinum TaxID=390894 RepID=A0A6A6RDV5_9PEZI|nr:hypothetical protein BU16DRAFT_576687 [Lophium mytilinum]
MAVLEAHDGPVPREAWSVRVNEERAEGERLTGRAPVPLEPTRPPSAPQLDNADPHAIRSGHEASSHRASSMIEADAGRDAALIPSASTSTAREGTGAPVRKAGQLVRMSSWCSRRQRFHIPGAGVVDRLAAASLRIDERTRLCGMAVGNRSHKPNILKHAVIGPRVEVSRARISPLLIQLSLRDVNGVMTIYAALSNPSPRTWSCRGIWKHFWGAKHVQKPAVQKWIGGSQ